MLDEVLQYYNATSSTLEMIYSFRLQTNRLEEAYTDSPWIERNGPILGKFNIITWLYNNR